jgi:hypothetical protein
MSETTKDVQKVQTPMIHASWHNVYDADRPMADISPMRSFPDGAPRSIWTANVIAIGGTITAIAGVLEGSMDGSNWYSVLTISTVGSVNNQNIIAKHFRVRITSVTFGTGYAYRVGVTAAGT